MKRPTRPGFSLTSRRLALAACSALALSACGLQQAGLDGTVAGRAVLQNGGSSVDGTTGGAPGATNGDGNGLTTGGGSGTTGDGSTGGGSGSTGGAFTGSTGGSSTSGSTGTVSGGTSGGSSSGTSGGSTSGGTGAAPQTPGLQGELTVSYVNVTGFDQLNAFLPVNVATTGDAVAQTNALASWVNSHGGIAGRKLKTVVHDYNAQQASEANDNNLCKAITDTDKAFLAVLHGQIHFSARNCYAAKKTLAFEGAAYGFGHNFYSGHSPYLWSPSYANYDQTSRALVETIKAKKWLAGETKVGIVLWDDEPYHEVADKSLAPLLKALGVEVVQASVSNADIGSIEDGIHAAAQTMVINQVDHLLFVGSAPLQPFFVQQNQQQSSFVYALTSFDVPRYMAVNFPRNMGGAIGIGTSPVDDVLDAQHAFPMPGLEATCRDIYKAGGVTIPGRYLDGKFNSKQAMSYCESTLLLKHVADTIPNDLTAAAWTKKAYGLGSSFQVAQTFSTSFSANKVTGATVYRDLAYNAECKCITYTSGNKALS